VIGVRPTRDRSYFSLIVLCLAALLLSLPQFACAQDSHSALVFYADRDVSPVLWPSLFSAIREDLADEDFGAAGRTFDHNPRLMRSSDLFVGEEFNGVVEVKLLGRCDVPQQAYRPLRPGPLGWVLRVKGQIQPYIYIDCTRMAQTLNATTLGMSGEQRQRAMSQAISHVLVHEWIHITTQNSGHTAHGITEAQLTPKRLVTSPDQSRVATEPDMERPAPVFDRGFGSSDK
jgi:hypothetical protein